MRAAAVAAEWAGRGTVREDRGRDLGWAAAGWVEVAAPAAEELEQVEERGAAQVPVALAEHCGKVAAGPEVAGGLEVGGPEVEALVVVDREVEAPVVAVRVVEDLVAGVVRAEEREATAELEEGPGVSAAEDLVVE